MTEWTFKGLHIIYFSVTALQKRSFSLTMSMTIFRSDCLCFLVKFWKMSQFSSCRSLKPTARWWFSNTDESLYISASSESAQETWLIILACGNGSFSHFKYRTWNSKVCHDNCNLKVELFKTFSRWFYSFFWQTGFFLFKHCVWVWGYVAFGLCVDVQEMFHAWISSLNWMRLVSNKEVSGLTISRYI